MTVLINKKQSGYEQGYNTAKKEILDFIEKERDNGNCLSDEKYLGGKGFSASLCLSKLIKYLEGNGELK